MTGHRYLVVGGGMTADAAVRAIREREATAEISILSGERHPPYNRPPLSKGLWKGDRLESIWRGTPDLGVALHLGRTAVGLDPEAHRVTDDAGREYAYDRLLLATGGSPRRLPSAGADVIYFRGLDDYERLRALAGPGRRVAVIGGGFVGSEVAAGLRLVGTDVVMIFPEEGIGGRPFGPDLSRFVTDTYRARGVEIVSGTTVAAIERRDGRSLLRTASGRELAVDAVVAGLGIEPRVELAARAGLPTGNGILVDQHLRTSHPDVFAAGDVANVFSPALGERIRVEHEDAANTMGAAAGRNMAGPEEPYTHLPFFYSDLFDLGYEAVGVLDSRLEMVADWKEPFREGVVYYVKDGRVRGALLWNVWGKVDAARALIALPGPFRPEDLEGRITA